MILVAISKLLILLAAVEAISFHCHGHKVWKSFGDSTSVTTQVDDGVQQRYDFTSTFGSGEKKKKK